MYWQIKIVYLLKKVEQIGKLENTTSRWCPNESQPSIAQLQEIANLLDVDVRELWKS